MGFLPRYNGDFFVGRSSWLIVAVVSVVVLATITLLVVLIPDVSTEPTAQRSIETTTRATVLSTEPSASNLNTETNASWQTIVTIISVLTTLAAVSISFYLYRWRRILLAEHPNALVPEEWGGVLRANNKTLTELADVTGRSTQTLSQSLIPTVIN